MKKKVLYSALYRDNGYPFHNLAHEVHVATDPDELKESDSFLLVWGGADIDPGFYRHPMHQTTRPGGLRDRLEWTLMNEAKDRGIPIIGVCRGAQMLCALAGGFLIQDVHNHAGYGHMVKTSDDQSFHVNSLHHQMMCMENMPAQDYELIVWREGREGAPYGYRDNRWFEPPEGWREPEFVYFPRIKGYAVQWHPEMMADECRATQYILDFINKKEEENDGSYAYRAIDCSC